MGGKDKRKSGRRQQQKALKSERELTTGSWRQAQEANPKS